MSNDLLIDLDDFYRGPDIDAPKPANPGFQPNPLGQSFQFPSITPTPQQQPQATPATALDDDDDDWGGFETAETQAPAPQLTSPQVPIAPSVASQAASDPFGDLFSNLSSGPAPPTQPALALPQQRQEQAPPVRTRVVRASTIDLMTNNLVDFGISSNAPASKPSWSQSQPVEPPRKKDPNVLFDADDIDVEDGIYDDDEFGDFETGEALNNAVISKVAAAPVSSSQPPKATKTPASADLLGDLDLLTPEHAPEKAVKKPGPILGNLNTSVPPPFQPPLKSPSFQERNPYKGLAISAPKQGELKKSDDPNSPSPVTAWPDLDEGAFPVSQKDEWAPWDDSPEDKPAAKNPATTKITNSEPEPDNWDWDAVDELPDEKQASSGKGDLTSLDDDDYDDKEPPPTNIPPPSILMTILPGLFNLANNSLFQPTARQSAAAKKKVMSDPATISFLKGYLLIATVAGRILAGRKLRWHRDKFLAQGMAISAAGAKGMKLAGVNKAEAAREDREAADVVTAWKGQVGRVRSAVVAANAAMSASGLVVAGQQLKVPEISASMHVSTAKVVPTAPRQCVVCGLKRDERVAKVDFEVEDSFGEWWVDHWGHRACRNFWKRHEKALRQR
ncbi:hypothetical protein jhhlp_006894 [Lomentospora prolificans]|uniref:Serine/threonine-protein kinase ppk6 n=1 Tax=Lomentospora prolificans TaxID=41688 RepID=A0A2N3N319_9PEZI|nr:hypothetical protein jhhlp_006894 [Lomentospora prolificans]